jgi:hypothetical protein
MPGSSGGSSSGAPLKYHMVYTPTVPAAIVQLHSYSAVAGSSHATTVDHASWVSVLQLWKSWALYQGVLPAEAEQLTTHSSACGESGDGPAEKPSTVI